MVRTTLPPLLLFISFVIGSEVDARERTRTNSNESVQGLLVMHGEYPHFIRRIGGKDIAYEIDIKDAEWKENYRPILKLDMTFSEPLFCVMAIGYEDKDKLGATGRSTFVFDRITSTKEVKDEHKCFS